MSDIITRKGPVKAPELPSKAQGRISAILKAGTAQNTLKAIRSDLAVFEAWFEQETGSKPDFPVSVDALLHFIADQLETYKTSTVSRRISSISTFHEIKELQPNPCRSAKVKTLLSKARKAASKNQNSRRVHKAVTLDILNKMLEACGDSLIDIRDKALLLFAFSSGGRRRSEVASALMENLTKVKGGFIYRIPRSKNDQTGEGLTVPVMGKAGQALTAWLDITGIASGAIFRGVNKGGRLSTEGTNSKLVNRVVKKRAQKAGLNPNNFGAHSLRSGFVTEAGRQGKSLGDVMLMTGHKTVSIAMRYHQAGNVLNNSAARLAD